MDTAEFLAKAQRVTLKLLLIAVALTVIAQFAHAAPASVPYDAVKRQKLETMIALYVGARTCMYDGSKVMLRQGVRNRVAIEGFTTAACSPALRAHLVSQMGWSAEDAARLISTLAALELDAASFVL